MTECADCNCFRYGDAVEHRLNDDLFGIVVGFMGSLIGIRVSPTLAVLWFHEWELRPLEDDEYDGPESDDVEPGSNVINFTKAAGLRVNTTTKGAA
jgi:hypothetical protein